MYDGKSAFSFSGVDDEYWGLHIEMVTFEQLCEIYLAQTRDSARNEKTVQEHFKKVRAEHDQIIRDSGLDNEGWNSGGIIL